MGVSEEQQDKEALKRRMRSALDVLQNYMTHDGKIDTTKLTETIKDLQRENAEFKKLLKEGADGFGRVLIATSDDKAVRDWQKRCRAALRHLETRK